MPLMIVLSLCKSFWSTIGSRCFILEPVYFFVVSLVLKFFVMIYLILKFLHFMKLFCRFTQFCGFFSHVGLNDLITSFLEQVLDNSQYKPKLSELSYGYLSWVTSI